MNLVAFEYVACQEQRNGVLVLSEFAGASVFMDGTIKFHPANIKEISQSIHKALLMSKEERKERYGKLRRFIDENTRWVVISFLLQFKYTNTCIVPNGAMIL
jgi:trehalose 6-phosphate synthase